MEGGRMVGRAGGGWGMRGFAEACVSVWPACKQIVLLHSGCFVMCGGRRPVSACLQQVVIAGLCWIQLSYHACLEARILRV